MTLHRFICWFWRHVWKRTHQGWTARDFATWRVEYTCVRCGARKTTENGLDVERS